MEKGVVRGQKEIGLIGADRPIIDDDALCSRKAAHPTRSRLVFPYPALDLPIELHDVFHAYVMLRNTQVFPPAEWEIGGLWGRTRTTITPWRVITQVPLNTEIPPNLDV